MFSIDTFYSMTNFVLNKTQTANATPARFNLAVNMGTKSLFKRYDAIPEVADRGGNAMAFSESTDIEKVMRLFKKTITLYIDTFGLTNVPSDFARESTLTYVVQENGIVKYNPVDINNDAEFQEAKNSYIVPATKDNPICRFIGTKIEFAPTNLVNVQMVYLRMPLTPLWAFTLSGNRPVYDATNSVDIEFPDEIINDLLMLTVQYLGVNMERQQIINYTEQYKEKGQ